MPSAFCAKIAHVDMGMHASCAEFFKCSVNEADKTDTCCRRRGTCAGIIASWMRGRHQDASWTLASVHVTALRTATYCHLPRPIARKMVHELLPYQLPQVRYITLP